MSDYTPTTEDVRRNFVEQYSHESLPAALSMTSAEWDVYLAAMFDRWLAEVKAAAWDEGYADAIDDYGTDIPWGGTTSDHNPHRT